MDAAHDVLFLLGGWSGSGGSDSWSLSRSLVAVPRLILDIVHAWVPKTVAKISDRVPQGDSSEQWGHLLARVLWAPPASRAPTYPSPDTRVFGMFRQASDREAVYACFTFSHWLVYANSAANPIIYNFLSGKWTVGVMTEDGHGPWVHLKLGGEDAPAVKLSLGTLHSLPLPGAMI